VRLSELRIGMRVIWWWNNHHCHQAEQLFAKVRAVHKKTVTVEFQDPLSQTPRLRRRQVYPAFLQSMADWQRAGRPAIRNLIRRKKGMGRWRRERRSEEPAWDRVKVLYLRAAREGKGFVCGVCGAEELVKPPRLRAARSVGRLAFHLGWLVVEGIGGRGELQVVGPECARGRYPSNQAPRQTDRS
jgi:hypothetical protein